MSDEEIVRYLKKYWKCDDFVFDCVITKHPKNPEKYKAQITSLKYNGRILKYPNGNNVFFNIKPALPYGDFKLRFTLTDREFRENVSHNMYMLTPVLSSLSILNPNTKSEVFQLRKEENQKRTEKGKTEYTPAELELFEYWGVTDCNFIGYFHYDEGSGYSIVSDIRKSNFANIPYYPNDRFKRPISLEYKGKILGIEQNSYNLFNWKLSGADSRNPYEIYIDFDFKPQPIRPKWFIDQLFKDRYEDKSKNFESSTNFLDTLSKQLSAKDSTFIYELLQNANDYPKENMPVDVEFHITDNYLIFMHSGEFFNERNISGICGINEKEKSANRKAIGYKGIGFKTVFLNNHYVHIKTGDYSFRFEKGSKKIKRLEAPWPILPIWTDASELPTEVSTVFEAADSKSRVKIALRPDDPAILHSGRNNYESLFKDIFEDSNLILFIPNIRSVKVFIGNELIRNCVIDENKWLVSDYEEDIDEDFQKLVNKDIDTGKSRIPEKYMDFDRTKVSFACRKDGRKLHPVEASHLYCYLPTSASWGFPFLLNTDMIPKGDRDDIEMEVYLKDEDETNFNLELAKIAGEKFFCWIQDLVKSGEYDYDSIFSLIPNFKKCIEGTDEKYKDFIEKFQEGFELKMKDAAIIPALVDKKIVFKSVEDIIYDMTGLSCAGIMTDEEILSMSGWSDYYPHPLLRDHAKLSLHPGIKAFLATYRSDEKVYDKDILHGVVEGSGFQEWLVQQEKNDMFLEFLLKKNLIDHFKDSPIFLAESGGLQNPIDLYYSVDDYFKDLAALDTYLDRLSLKTRKQCEADKNWEDFKVNFKKFDPENFVDDILLDLNNKDDVHEILSNSEVSLSFMNFLACNVGFAESYKKFPFVDAGGSIIDSFSKRAFVFAPSKEAESVHAEAWIDDEWIAVVSSSYNDVVQKYLLNNFGVKAFENKIIVDDIICKDNYQDYINERIVEYEISKSFVDYAFRNREFIDDGVLECYYVSAYDKDGEESFLSETKNHIYLRNKIYNEAEKQPWLDNGIMYALNEVYYQGSGYDVEYKKFFHEKFSIPMMTNKLFFEDIVLKQVESINDNLDDKDNNIAFWHWAKTFAKEVADIPSFAPFNLLVKELGGGEYSVSSPKDNGIYLSNAYQPASDIEAIVKKYAPDALFVAADYLEDKTSGTILGWVDFFKNLGVKITMVDLVFGKIIPNVGDIEEDGLPILLGQYYAEIHERWEEILDNGKSVKGNLESIRVKTRDGKFSGISDCILVDVGKDKEPFADIKFDKEISDATAANRNAKKLLLDIATEAGSLIIKDVTKWQECKLDEYAGNEDSYSIETHIGFMEELAAIDTETLKTFESRKSLRLLDTKDEYMSPKALTLGSDYKTSCLFDKHDVTEGLHFLSHRYVNANEDGKFADLVKKVLGIHYRFEKDDISNLSNFRFAVYFWSDYAIRHVEFVEGLIKNGDFDNSACVPTMAGNVYAPSDVYSRKILDYVAKKIPEWEDKLPTDQIPVNKDENKDLINILDLKEQLSFEDGLSALHTIKSKEKRREILEWMNKDYNSSYSNLVTEYRNGEDAIWKNGKAEEKHISELYAIAPDSRTLREFFRDNKYVLISDYISLWNVDNYRSICKMMQIPIIEEDDMTVKPDGVQDSIARYFEGRLLVVAGIEYPEKWSEAFDKYKEKIASMTFWRCSSISWAHKDYEQISQNRKTFYAKDGDFYYVKNWCTIQVYTDFVRSLYDYLVCRINKDQFAKILDPNESIEDLLEEYYSIRTDDYIAELAKYDNSYLDYDGPKVNNEVEEDDDVLESKTSYEPAHATEVAQEKDEPEETEDNGLDVSEEVNAHEESDDEIESLKEDDKHGDRSSNAGGSTSTEVAIASKSETDEFDSAVSNTDPLEDGAETEPDDEDVNEFDPDEGEPIGDVTKDRRNYEPLGSRPKKLREARRMAAKPFTKDEVNRLRSNGTPLELESLPPTQEELDVLSQCGISPEQIADTNYLAQLRLYRNIQKELGEDPVEKLSEFVRNADDVAEHKMKSGKYIHACSAARGVMYISPSVWGKMVDEKWVICVYLDGKGKNFHYINTTEEFLKLVQKDDVVIKLTGKEKVDVVNELYSGLLQGVKGTVYTLIRVASRTNMDAVFAHYIGSMAEKEDGYDYTEDL